MRKRYGASPRDWAHFKILAKVDLLPVVSNPQAELSPRTKMKATGKTPSLFNADGHAIGFKDWTDHETTVGEIEAWAQEPDYGICIQTRRYRAIDIDVDDEDLSDKIEARFLELAELESAPCRFRSNSGKRLLLVYAEGDLRKDAFPVKEWQDEDGKTKRWLVELLADGQQFIAAGTHTSGVRYQWRGGPPTRADVPRLKMAQLTEAFATLKEELAVADWKTRPGGNLARWSKEDDDAEIEDEIAEWLDAEGLVLEKGRGGVWAVECPGAAGHSPPHNPSSTVWLCRKTGRRGEGSGVARGGVFNCKHAGCQGVTTAEFLKHVGYFRAVFSDLRLEEDDGSGAQGEPLRAGHARLGVDRPASDHARRDSGPDDGEAEDDTVRLYAKLSRVTSTKSMSKARAVAGVGHNGGLPLPGFDRDPQGRIESNLHNVVAALSKPHVAGHAFAFDTFRGELMIAETPGDWRPLTDADAVQLRLNIEGLLLLDDDVGRFKAEIGKEKMRDALELMGDRYQFDSAIEWLLNVVPAWDGVPRIHRFWPDYMKTKDTPYTRALGEYSWTAQAGRVLDPGCKVDMVPVLVGEEGTRKSTAVSLIAPNEDFFTEFNLGLEDEKLSRLMRGTLVGELAELRGISARDAEGVLAWVTRKHEKWTPKFKEYAISLARRLVFYGTTNDPEFLQAHMGQRRWLPVTILAMIDTDAIIRDRLQLWAEAREVFLESGIAFERVERLAKAERTAFEYRDAWFETVSKGLDDTIGEDDDDNVLTLRNCGTLTTERVLIDLLGFDDGRIKRADQMRAAAVLKACGMRSLLKRVGSRPVRVWVDGSA